jgi:hypothetical protein
MLSRGIPFWKVCIGLTIDDVLFEAVRGFFTSIFEVFTSVNDFKNTGLFLEVTRSGVDLALVLLTRTRGVTSPSFFGILADSFLWTGLLPACSTEFASFKEFLRCTFGNLVVVVWLPCYKENKNNNH